MISVERRRARGGFTIAELIIAMMLLGTATAVMLPLMVSVSAQRRAAEHRQLALIAAENLLDEILARPWNEITEQTLSKLPATDAASLPGLQRRIAVAERPEDAARQITVELHWRNRAGDFTAPLRLSAWKFAPLEVTP